MPSAVPRVPLRVGVPQAEGRGLARVRRRDRGEPVQPRDVPHQLPGPAADEEGREKGFVVQEQVHGEERAERDAAPLPMQGDVRQLGAAGSGAAASEAAEEPQQQGCHHREAARRKAAAARVRSRTRGIPFEEVAGGEGRRARESYLALVRTLYFILLR